MASDKLQQLASVLSHDVEILRQTLDRRINDSVIETAMTSVEMNLSQLKRQMEKEKQ